MKRSILLCALLLAACGADAGETEKAAEASDSAAVEAITGQGVVKGVNRQLDQAQKDAAARQAQADSLMVQ